MNLSVFGITKLTEFKIQNSKSKMFLQAASRCFILNF